MLGWERIYVEWHRHCYHPHWRNDDNTRWQMHLYGEYCQCGQQKRRGRLYTWLFSRGWL